MASVGGSRGRAVVAYQEKKLDLVIMNVDSRNLLGNLADEFATRFSRTAEFVARAPGRVNLIGEHTD